MANLSGASAEAIAAAPVAGTPTQVSRNRDFYGTPAVSEALSLFHGLFTYNIPTEIWLTGNTASGNGTASSVDGMLTLTTGSVTSGTTYVQSREHLRYEPDRSIRFATATPGFPSGTAARVRVGQFNDTHGYYLEYDSSDSSMKLYTRNTTGIVAPSPEDHTSGLGSATTTDTLQSTLTVPAGCDLTKATLIDIEAQWRSAGEIRCSLNLKDAGGSARLGVSSVPWTGNPGLAVKFEAISDGADETFTFGCVDVTSMGGRGPVYHRLAGEVAEVTMNSTERPAAAIQATGFLGGMPCTRDTVLLEVGFNVSHRCVVRVYRNATASGMASWANFTGDSVLIIGTGQATSTVDTTGAELLHSEVFEAAGSGKQTFIAGSNFAPVKISPIAGVLTTGANRGDPAYGDTIVVTVQKSTGSTMTASIEGAVGEEF